MSKTRLLTILVVVLVVINLTMVTLFFLDKPNHRSHRKNNGGPKNVIIEKLHFDKVQKAAYKELIKEHKRNISKKDEELKSAKKELYLILSEENETDNSVLIAHVNAIQKEIEEIHFNHFLDIKRLCKNDQLEDYNELTHELARLFAPRHKLRK